MRALFICALIVTLTTVSYGVIQDRIEPGSPPSNQNRPQVQQRQGRTQPADRRFNSPQASGPSSPAGRFPDAQFQNRNSPSGNSPRGQNQQNSNQRNPFGQLAPNTFKRNQAPQALNNPFGSTPANFFQGNNSTQRKIDDKLREYRSAEKEDQKSKIEAEIKELLDQQFDEKMKHPIQRIEESRKRLDELQAQIKQRDEKSDEIVDLRVTVLTNQAIGLGWGSSHGSANQPFFSNSQNFGHHPGPIANHPQRIAQSPGPGIPFGQQPWPRPQENVAPDPNTRPARVANQGGPDHFNPNRTGPDRGKSNRAPRDNQKQLERPVTVNELLRDFKEAKEDSERKPIVKALRERLVEEFQNHQKGLKSKASQIEKSISDLESNIEKRKEAKASIVDLKLKTVINQANGLGF